MKKLFFKVLLEFSTLNYENAIKLAQYLYNCRRPHSSLFKNTPVDVHHCSHIASQVIRQRLAQFKHRQKKLRNIFSAKPQHVFKLNEHVLLRNKRHAFHRASSVFHPHFQDTVRTITDVDRRYLPFTYSLSGYPPEKKFYFWELKRVSPLYGNIQPAVIPPTTGSTEPNSKILVKECVTENTSFLRSGKKIPQRKSLLYVIERDGKSEKITSQALAFFKKVLGAHNLIYSNYFDIPSNTHLKI